MDPVIVREWDNEKFHQRVLELEAFGYVARRETYSVTAEQHPDTGYIVHLFSMEMYPVDIAAEHPLDGAPPRQ